MCNPRKQPVFGSSDGGSSLGPLLFDSGEEFWRAIKFKFFGAVGDVAPCGLLGWVDFLATTKYGLLSSRDF